MTLIYICVNMWDITVPRLQGLETINIYKDTDWTIVQALESSDP